MQEISERTGESMASLYDRISKGTLQISEITESMRAATSEGGKFFQSMEKQSKTLNGQLSTLKDNASQLLGALTSDLSEGLRSELLPLANNMIGELQEAFESGGMDSLVTTATDMIPDLLGMMTGKLENAISGVTRWLPQGASKIMSAFPAALKSTTAVVPQITSALFEVASVVVTDLVAMLPELAPVLGKGVIDLATSVLFGVEDVVEGLFTGIEQAFHQGERKIAGVWVDETRLAKYDFDIEANVDETSVSQEIEGAKREIINILSGIEGIDAEEIADAIISGDVEEALEAALIHAGVDPKAAKRVADTIEESRRIISAAIENLAIDDEIISNVREMVADGASENEIAAYIEGFGVDPAVARETAAKIAESQKIISSAIAGLGLSDEAAAHIQQMIDNGESENEIAAYIESLGVDPAVAQETAKTISGAVDIVSNAVVGLGLSEQAENTIREMVDAGATKNEIAAYIESLGVDPEVANNAAKTITDAAKTVDKSIKGLPDDIRASIDGLEVSDEKELLVSALQMMGLDEADIKAVLASYDSTSGLLSAGITGIFSNIADSLTDGLPDTDEVLSGLENEIREWAREAHEKINAWYASAVADLNASGKTGAEYDAALLDIETKANEMHNSVRESEVGAIEFMNSMAGRSKEDVKLHLDELKAIGEEAANVSAEIDALTAKMNSASANAFNVVRSGANADEQTISMAISYKVTEMKLDEQSAEDAYNQAVKDLNAQLSAGEITQEEYDVSISDEQATLEAAKKTAREKFQNAFSEIMRGIAESEGIENVAAETAEKISLAESIMAAMAELPDQGLVGDQLGEELTGSLAAYMQIDPEILKSMSTATAKSAMEDWALSLYTEATSAINGLEKSKLAETYAKALEQGILEGTQYDTESTSGQIENMLIGIYQTAAENASDDVQTEAAGLVTDAFDAMAGSKNAGDKRGDEFGKGYVDAVGSWETAAYNQGYALAKATSQGAADGQESASPSKVAKRLGNYFGDGYNIGLRESMARAVATARGLTGNIATAAAIPSTMRQNMPNIAQEVATANGQTVTPVYLDGKQIAAIQGHNNSVQLAWDNNRSAKGVGRK